MYTHIHLDVERDANRSAYAAHAQSISISVNTVREFEISCTHTQRVLFLWTFNQGSLAGGRLVSMSTDMVHEEVIDGGTFRTEQARHNSKGC